MDQSALGVHLAHRRSIKCRRLELEGQRVAFDVLTSPASGSASAAYAGVIDVDPTTSEIS